MKTFTTLLVVLIAQLGSAQDDHFSFGDNELKINLLTFITGFPEIAYERIITKDLAIGTRAGLSIDDDVTRNYSINPYVRFYFGEKKRAAGFFVGLQGAFYSEDDAFGNSYNGAGLGVNIGAKFLTRRGWVFEFYAGGGRNLINKNNIDEYFGTGGIKFGKRF